MDKPKYWAWYWDKKTETFAASLAKGREVFERVFQRSATVILANAADLNGQAYEGVMAAEGKSPTVGPGMLFFEIQGERICTGMS